MHNVLLFLGGLGGWEIMIILLVVLVFFGANKIPEIARGMGRGIREFKDATKEIKDEIENNSVRLDK
ncbi:MAG: twin-arginine translocase TatA/TatE family subunit [Tunicatimonas sp.]|jgi:sec-independent protein translocase protein TatA